MAAFRVKTPTYSDMPAAQAFYTQVANGTSFVTAPIRAFSHNSADPGFQNQAITAGEAIYTGNVYPASLKNNFFFTNFTNGQIFAIDINNRADVKFLYSVSGDAPTDFVQGPDGSVYYADLINGVIGRLDITDSTTPVGTPVTLAVGSGPDTLVLKISQDAFQGSAQYTVSVDGVQIGGTLTAGASHAAGQDDTISVLGNFAPGPHRLTVNFLNDLYNGTPDTDRNLYVDGITYDSATVPNGTAALMSAGPLDFAFTDSGTVSTPKNTTIGSGPDSLVLKISQDAFQGSAQYTVSVDGKQIGGVLTASSLHGSGAGRHDHGEGQLRDRDAHAHGELPERPVHGTPETDRNLYVDGVTFNGTAVPGATATLLSAGSTELRLRRKADCHHRSDRYQSGGEPEPRRYRCDLGEPFAVHRRIVRHRQADRRNGSRAGISGPQHDRHGRRQRHRADRRHRQCRQCGRRHQPHRGQRRQQPDHHAGDRRLRRRVRLRAAECRHAGLPTGPVEDDMGRQQCHARQFPEGHHGGGRRHDRDGVDGRAAHSPASPRCTPRGTWTWRACSPTLSCEARQLLPPSA